MKAQGDTAELVVGDEQLKGETSLDEVESEVPEADEAAEEAEREKLRREREARAQALTLEIVGDLPYAEVKPPENVLFVCKLNPVTEDEDLNTIFSRFGTIVSCEVIRDKRTGDSLQYAFIEYENQKDCEQAYTKMSGVLIDDHRIHVDFSQSVSRLSDTWRNKTNTRRREQAGGFGGVAGLEKKRQYRKVDPSDHERREKDRYRMVFDKGNASKASTSEQHAEIGPSRSRSPDPNKHRRDQWDSHWLDRDRSRDRDREDRPHQVDYNGSGNARGERSGGRGTDRGDKGRYGGRDEYHHEERRRDRRRSNDRDHRHYAHQGRR